MSTSKTGKHGHAKVSLAGLDIFTGKKYEMIESSTHNVEVPNVTRAEFQVWLQMLILLPKTLFSCLNCKQLIDINDEGFMSLMSDDGSMKEDLRVPEGAVGDEIKEKFEDGQELLITTVSAMGQEQALSYKIQKE